MWYFSTEIVFVYTLYLNNDWVSGISQEKQNQKISQNFLNWSVLADTILSLNLQYKSKAFEIRFYHPAPRWKVKSLILKQTSNVLENWNARGQCRNWLIGFALIVRQGDDDDDEDGGQQ